MLLIDAAAAAVRFVVVTAPVAVVKFARETLCFVAHQAHWRPEWDAADDRRYCLPRRFRCGRCDRAYDAEDYLE